MGMTGPRLVVNVTQCPASTHAAHCLPPPLPPPMKIFARQSQKQCVFTTHHNGGWRVSVPSARTPNACLACAGCGHRTCSTTCRPWHARPPSPQTQRLDPFCILGQSSRAMRVHNTGPRAPPIPRTAPSARPALTRPATLLEVTPGGGAHLSVVCGAGWWAGGEVPPPCDPRWRRTCCGRCCGRAADIRGEAGCGGGNGGPDVPSRRWPAGARGGGGGVRAQVDDGGIGEAGVE